MADARVISNGFVAAAKADGNTLSPMQVLKLVYIAHGYSLGHRGVPLISNRIEAWKFGPVIPDLYHAIKEFRSQPVKALNVDQLGEQMDAIESDFVNATYDAYKNFDGIQLSNLTHQVGTPWQQVFDPARNSIAISNDLIEHHYKAKLNG